MKNTDVREHARKAAVPHWKIAEQLGISENTFSRKLRHELNEEEKTKIFEAIDEIAG